MHFPKRTFFIIVYRVIMYQSICDFPKFHSIDSNISDQFRLNYLFMYSKIILRNQGSNRLRACAIYYNLHEPCILFPQTFIFYMPVTLSTIKHYFLYVAEPMQ